MSTDADWLARVAHVEEIKASIAAEHAGAFRVFSRAHVFARIASGDIDPVKHEHSISAQIGLACRVSSTEGRKRLRIARDLHDGHTHVRELFAAGVLSEYKTSLIVAATAHLSRQERAKVDQRLT